MSRALPVSMVVVAGGTIVAQLVNILGFVVATRFLSPHDFGLFGLHIAISAPLAVLATGRYEVAFIHEGRLARVANLFALSVCAAVASTAAVAVLLRGILEVVGSGPELSIAVTCALLLGQALVNCTTQLNNYNRSYGLIAASRVTGAAVAQLTVIALAALAGVNDHALGTGMAFGMLASVAVSIAGNSGWLRTGLRTVSANRMRVLARRNISYILFNGPQALASAVQESAAVAVITAFFGQAATGFYVFTNRLMRAPISIVAESVGRVLQRHFGDLAHSGEAERARFLRASIVYLVAIAIGFCLACWIAARPAVALAFSPEWAPLGELMRASAAYYAAYLVAAALAPIPLATGDYKPMAVLGIFGSALYVVLLTTTGAFKLGLSDAFVFVSMGMAAYFAAFVYAVHHIVVRRHAR